MRSFLFFISVLLFSSARANDSAYLVKIHFLYGSKPAKGFKETEQKLFGGLKGGHVNIEAGGRVLDFMPGENPLFPKNKNPTGGFRINNSVYWNTSTDKWTTVIVPLTEKQYSRLQVLFSSFSAKTPYDYAIFGMRCAAASYDVLANIGLFKVLSPGDNIRKHFYPKLLRKKVLKWAEKNNYSIETNDGRPSRKWESDKGIF